MPSVASLAALRATAWSSVAWYGRGSSWASRSPGFTFCPSVNRTLSSVPSTRARTTTDWNACTVPIARWITGTSCCAAATVVTGTACCARAGAAATIKASVNRRNMRWRSLLCVAGKQDYLRELLGGLPAEITDAAWKFAPT